MSDIERDTVLLAPDRCTKYRASAAPSADQLTDWCQPRSAHQSTQSQDRWVSGFAAMQRQLPRRLVGVWAHPDDEAYLSAGLMARIVQTGGAVTIVTLTDGEGGFPADDQRPVRVRVQQRRLEMSAAMAEIGVTDIRFLGVADGGVAAASAQDIVASIASVMNEVRPDLVVTFGPDGITGHEDHIANWRLATSAWLSCGHGALWYAAKTQSWLDEWRDLHDRFGVWMTDEQKGISNSDVQSVVDLDPRELARKRRVLAAHASQTAGLAAAFGEDRYRKWIRQEVFRPANAADLGAADDLAVTRSAELLAMVA